MINNKIKADISDSAQDDILSELNYLHKKNGEFISRYLRRFGSYKFDEAKDISEIFDELMDLHDQTLSLTKRRSVRLIMALDRSRLVRVPLVRCCIVKMMDTVQSFLSVVGVKF